LAIIESAVNYSWAICLAREDAAAIGALRLAPGIEVGDAGVVVWLRGKPGDERLEAKLAALPASARYEWLAPNQLRKIHERIPGARLPDVPWQSLDRWLQIEVPASAIPADAPRPVQLRLVRSVNERTPDLLLTTLDEVQRFAANAAQVRLARLQFAANSEGEVLVRGQPLPPLPGKRFVIRGGVAVPAGFSWTPEVGEDALARRFAVSGDALVVWNEDESVTRLHVEQFVPLSRSALRATQQALAESR
jgi:hypothetical protein